MDAFYETDATLAYRTLRAGGLVLLPTDVGYGLVAMEDAAVEKLYELKGRPLAKPCVTVVNDRIFDALVRPVDANDRRWLSEMGRRSPIAVIARVDPGSQLLRSMSPLMRMQATHEGSIATFFSAGPLVERIAEMAHADGRLVVGSSANRSGTGNNYAFHEVPASIRDAADAAIDRGPAWFANNRRLATTILDLRTGSFQRRGINFAFIERSWNMHRRVKVTA